MPKKVRLLLIGDAELRAKLSALTDAEARKAVLGATREAAKVIQAEAKRTAPKRTGALRRSIKVRAIKRSRKRIGMRVTTSKLDSVYQGKTFYGAFQEYGWKTGARRNTQDALARRIAAKLRSESRAARKDGKGLAARGTDMRATQEKYFIGEGRRQAATAKFPERRQIEGKHFMQLAADRKKDEALTVFKTRIDDHIKKVMAKRK